MKVYVMASRCGTELGTPTAFADYREAYKQMESEFKSFKREGYNDAHIEAMYAFVELKSGDCAEWTIAECEVPTPVENIKPDICPLCGETLNLYSEETIENGCTCVDWDCPGCGTSGTYAFDKDGNLIKF